MLAHLACRTLLSVSLSSIPITGSPAVSGLALLLPCDNWHLSTFHSIALTRRGIQLFRNTGLWQRAVYCRLLVPGLAMILLSRTASYKGTIAMFLHSLFGICPAMIVDLPWTHAKARAQTLDEHRRCSSRCNQEKRLVFIQDPGCTPCPGSCAAKVAIA